ncbi:hypothetical protein MICAF_5650006 [Microcystis aeruginosa PCC 9807]|uniref:Uncharacterized protein n=2 Tax=Microcystis TaxID=1125 RepID=I4HCX8_MICAE|nr:hypothetical protein VL20_5144 [Microcystis panniformis FACHB-1757]CCI19902.1 hypothetical protein MICAF_5650006 [Microcystis aeruginosa PCC 9807]
MQECLISTSNLNARAAYTVSSGSPGAATATRITYRGRKIGR